MGDIVQFRARKKIEASNPVARLVEEGLGQEKADICMALLEEINTAGISPPFVRGGYNGGFLLLWMQPNISVAIEAPGGLNQLWSMHRHDKASEFQPCYEIRFQYNGDNKEVAAAVKEALGKT